MPVDPSAPQGTASSGKSFPSSSFPSALGTGGTWRCISYALLRGAIAGRKGEIKRTSGREGRIPGSAAGQEGLRAEQQHPANGQLRTGTKSVQNDGVSLLGLTKTFLVPVPLVLVCRRLPAGCEGMPEPGSSL